MDTRAVEINIWLRQPDSKFLVICGMGGSGKTTLAKHIYNSNRKSFENASFVEDIGNKCGGIANQQGLAELQRQLLYDISGGKKRKIPSISRGTCKIEEVLQKKKALIVLDDIVSYVQLVALLGTGNLNEESKIIITTREWLDTWFGSTQIYRKYDMKLLNDDESLELLSHHAFNSRIPVACFEGLTMRSVRYCGGNPLALEVLGSSLSRSNTISYWESHLKLLEKDMDSRIQSVLVRSYEALPFKTEKELFLHIACFFIGKDMDYVIKILEPDYSATLGIKILMDRCLVSVLPNKKLTMHRLIQEMGRNIVRQESFDHPEKRSRVWDYFEAERIMRRGMGSKTMTGLAIDAREVKRFKWPKPPSYRFNTDSLRNMGNLKLLELHCVEVDGSYDSFSEDLRWICWHGFHLRAIPSNLFTGSLVALDMSHSKLEIFEPPMVLRSLKILNLKDSEVLFEIRNIDRLPNLDSLILWNCKELALICETIIGLERLALLNMTGCKHICKKEQNNMLPSLNASTSSAVNEQWPTFSLPHSIQRLFLNECNLECTDSFPLSFSGQPNLQYVNLGNSLFEHLPYYDHLRNLRVLDLSFCSRLKWLLRLPSTLVELYIYYCELLEKVTFESHRFTLQELGYEGCTNLSEIEGFIKLVPVARLDETDLGHLKWLKEYENQEVPLVGDNELIIGRSWLVQMLYEFNIMSISLPDIKNSNMVSEYKSGSTGPSSLCFNVPPCPMKKRLKGLNVTFKYTIKVGDDDDDWVWFAKIQTTNGVNMMYNPRVIGKPGVGEVGMWLSYWPIGNTLDVGDEVNVSIIVLSGLMVTECGVSLVYNEDEVVDETLEKNMGWIEAPGEDISGFQLSNGAYYLCRRDLFELMEVGRLTPGWFSILVGDTIDDTEVRGWRKTGRPKQLNPSFTELKTVRCILYGPGEEEIYNVAEKLETSRVKESMEFTSSTFKETEKDATTSKAFSVDMDIDVDEASKDDDDDDDDESGW